jgi:hypothetical protein
MRVPLAVTLALLPLEALAEPSYPCNVRLTATEQAICDDPVLGDLDRQMAGLYFALHDGLSSGRQARLAEQQHLWRAWRGTCGADPACLRRRYEQRILDLAPAGSLQAGFGAAEEPVERRIRDGRSERVYADGRVEWQRLGGGTRGTDYPDGTTQTYMFVASPAPEFPALPGGFSGWGDRVEADLLSLIDLLLPEADRSAYRELQAGFSYSVRVLDDIRVIGFLVKD